MYDITIMGLCNILHFFTAQKMKIFRRKKVIIFFFFFAQNIVCAAFLMCIHNLHVIEQKQDNKGVNPSFTMYKWDLRGSHLHGSVILMRLISVNERCHEKTCLQGFQPGPTHTRLGSHRRS